MMEDSVNFKEKYQEMKKKLRFLVYEQECFLEELKKSQKKLLKLNRDKSFLLDELMQYEMDDAGASDSNATESSESDHTQPREPKKRKIMNLSHKVATTSHTNKILKTQKRKLHVNKTQASSENSASASKANPRPAAPKQEAHVMREEIERQLEMKHSSKPDFMNINFTSHHPPEDIFNNDSSNQDWSVDTLLI